jgi:hypothetical protein
MCNIAYIADYLDSAYKIATSLGQQHEMACAGTVVNLLAYLVWLRRGKVFGSTQENLQVV